MVPTVPNIKLNSGYEMPQVGFGLWKVDNPVAADTVYNAIKVGYRLFDGACGKKYTFSLRSPYLNISALPKQKANNSWVPGKWQEKRHQGQSKAEERGGGWKNSAATSRNEPTNFHVITPPPLLCGSLSKKLSPAVSFLLPH